METNRFMVEGIERSNQTKSSVESQIKNSTPKSKIPQATDFKELFDEKCSDLGFKVIDYETKKIEVTDAEKFYTNRQQAKLLLNTKS